MSKIPQQVAKARASALEEWFDKRNARCMWQVPASSLRPTPYGSIEGWLVPTPTGPKIVLCCKYRNGHGWEIFVNSSEQNQVVAALADLDRALGLV